MTQPIDVAYVDVVVRDKSLRKVKKDIKDTFDDIDDTIEKNLDGVDDQFEELFQKIDKRFRDLEDSVDGVYSEILDSTTSLTRSIDGKFKDTSKSVTKNLRKIGDEADEAFDDVERRVSGPLRRALSRLGDLVSDTIGLLGQLGSTLFSAVASNPLVFLILALIPPIIAVAAALSNLIGLVGILPSGLGVLIAAVAPLIIAFQGFGEAVAAIASGDIEKINEALKNLSPSARNAARELGRLLPVLGNFRRAIQEAFFGQLGAGAFTTLVGILPRITESLSGVAGALGRFARGFIDMLASLGSVQVINELLNTTARIIDQLSGPIIRLFDAIGSSVHESLPFVERIAAAFGRALDAFAAFINKAIETGDFDKFIEDAFTTVKELIDLLKAVGGLIGTIFAGTEQSGHDFIKTLTDVINQMNAFFKSAEGQRTLQDLVLIVNAVGQAIQGAVVTIGFLIFALHNSLDLFEFLGRKIGDFIGVVGDFLGTIPGRLRQFGDFLATIPGKIGNAFAAAVSAVGDFLRGVGAGIEEFGRFLLSIPTRIGNFLQAAFDRVLFVVGASIGLILFAVQVLPTKIAEFLATLPERVAAIFNQVRDFIINAFNVAVVTTAELLVNGFNAVMTFLNSIPGRVLAAFTLVKTFIITAITEAVTFARDTIVNGFNAVVSFIASVPDRIRELIPIFGRAGKNLIESFMNGFRSVGGFIGDVAGDIVGAVRGFLNRAIDRINSGIAAIDAVLPGDLARIPRLAQGAIVPHQPGGVLANVGEGSEDEVVAPLSKLMGMIRNAVGTGAGVTFGPGSINVSFNGAVPTPSEARVTGEQVGEGIISTLARRNIRAQVRAI